jgi:microcystin-dependent protein
MKFASIGVTALVLVGCASEQTATPECPPGTITAYGGANIPGGWLLCDGTPLNSLQYPHLFAAIRTNWGVGLPGSTFNFNLPDLRGLFLRGVTGSRQDAFADPDWTNRIAPATGGAVSNNVGSLQVDAVGYHRHNLYIGSLSLSLDGNANTVYNSGPKVSDVTYTTTNGFGIGSETRPKNAYVNYIIKY